jgi:hypothetical protein
MASSATFPILPPSIFDTGGKKDTFIIGIGHNSEEHLGVMLQMVKTQRKGEPLLKASFIVSQIGNAEVLEKFRLSGEVIEPSKLDEKFKDLFKCTNFCMFKPVINCNLRFRNGLNVTVLNGEGQGSSNFVHSIKKFPDNESVSGSALYNLTRKGDENSKLIHQSDDNLQLIQYHDKDGKDKE